MERKLSELAAKVGGTVVGDGSVVIRGVSGLEDAGPDQITFLANPKYAPKVRETKAAAIVITDGTPPPPIPAIVVKDPNAAFTIIVQEFIQPFPPPQGIHPSAVVSPKAKLGKNVAVGAQAVIEELAEIGDGTVIHPLVYIGHGVKIGRDCTIQPNVSIRERCILGDRVMLGCGTVIGSEGFGFATIKGRHEKIPQYGIVEIEDDVETGANCNVDRARFDRTILKKGTKLDNMVHLAHNVTVGEHVLIAAGTVIAGSVRIGNYAMLAGQVAVGGHLTVGEKSVLTGQAGLSKDLPPGQVYTGTPARPMIEHHRAMAGAMRVSELMKEVRDLRKRIAELEKRLK